MTDLPTAAASHDAVGMESESGRGIMIRGTNLARGALALCLLACTVSAEPLGMSRRPIDDQHKADLVRLPLLVQQQGAPASRLECSMAHLPCR